MRKILAVFSALFLLGASLAYADNIAVPRDIDGVPITDGDLSGWDVHWSTGTGAFGSTVPVVVAGLWFSHVSSSSYVVLRDSNTLNTSSTAKLVIGAGQVTANTTTDGNVRLYKFPAPIRFWNGMSANFVEVGVARAATSGGTGIVFRYVSQAKSANNPPYNNPSTYGTGW